VQTLRFETDESLQARPATAFAPTAAGIFVRNPAAAISARRSVLTQAAFSGYAPPELKKTYPKCTHAVLLLAPDSQQPVTFMTVSIRTCVVALCSRGATLRSASRGLASLNMKERERTFIMIKPDAVQRGLVGNIIT